MFDNGQMIVSGSMTLDKILENLDFESVYDSINCSSCSIYLIIIHFESDYLEQTQGHEQYYILYAGETQKDLNKEMK